MTTVCRPALSVLLLLAAFAPSSKAAEPRAFSTVAVLHDEIALNGAHDVELQGRFAFVAGKGGSLAIVDVADPARPRIVWSRRDEVQFADAETVLPAGDFLFVGTRDFVSVDIRDPLRTTVAQTISDRSQIDRINGFARRGDTVFAANKEGRINAFDVSDPLRPVLTAALDVAARDGIGKPHDVDLLGDHLIVVDPAGFGRRTVPGHVGIYKVFDDATGRLLPAEQWSLVGKVADERLVGGNRIRSRGRFAFVAASISPESPDKSSRQASLVVVEAGDPQHARVVARVPFPDVRGPNGMEVCGNVVFVSGGQTVMAVDVSDPHRPLLAAAERCIDVFRGEPGFDDGHDLKYRDGYLFVTGQTSHTFGVLRVNDDHIRRLADARP